MKLPVMLDMARIAIVVAGRGERLLARLDRLAGGRVRAFSDDRALRRAGLVPRLPTGDDFAGVTLVYLIDLPPAERDALAGLARGAGALVNVEDDRARCDFESPAVVRRGDLTIAVSTDGASPALARAIREFLERIFPPIWAERVARVGALRRRLRAGPAPHSGIAAASTALFQREGWFDDAARACAAPRPR